MRLFVLGLFVFLSLAQATAKSDRPVYMAVGEKVILRPGSAVNPITNITWRYGPDVAMQWDGNQTYSYGHFKVRGVLNTSSGELTITGLTRNDSGSYTAEINDQVTKPIRLLVISRVSRPSISAWCDPPMTYCVFTCEGNTSDAEPLTIGWRADDMVWPSGNKRIITKDETEPLFVCYLDNPVSLMRSDPVPNPFYTHRCMDGRYSLITLLTLCVVVILVLILLIWLTHRCRKGKKPQSFSPSDRESPWDSSCFEVFPLYQMNPVMDAVLGGNTGSLSPGPNRKVVSSGRSSIFGRTRPGKPSSVLQRLWERCQKSKTWVHVG